MGRILRGILRVQIDMPCAQCRHFREWLVPRTGEATHRVVPFSPTD